MKGGIHMSINFDKYKFSTGTHYIANSGSDENKAYKGGKAGDQTGHEAELRSWYNRPWSVCLRYPNQTVANLIADLSIAMCLNNMVGYDQGERSTYWKQLKAAGYDPSTIKIACEEDCTAGVSANVKAAGHICGIASLEDLPLCTSRNMLALFTKAGFVALTQSKYLTSSKYLLPGDILLYENHHAACNITCGKEVLDYWNPQPLPEDPALPDGGESDETDAPEIQPPCVLITGSSVYVRKGPDITYGYIGTVHKGTRLKYFGYDYPANGWHLIEYLNQTGWVSGKYSHLEI